MLAAMQGYSPEHNMNKVVPDPMAIKQISTFYNANGSINQWVIAEPTPIRKRTGFIAMR